MVNVAIIFQRQKNGLTKKQIKRLKCSLTTIAETKKGEKISLFSLFVWHVDHEVGRLTVAQLADRFNGIG